MKHYEVLIEFRREYQKLRYLESGMKVYELEKWVSEWCGKNSIDKDSEDFFQRLALAYIDKDLFEELIDADLKKIDGRRKNFPSRR